MTTSNAGRVRLDLNHVVGTDTLTWVEVPNCTAIRRSMRALEVSSSCWEGTKWIPIQSIHETSEMRDLDDHKFGAMIILERYADKLDIPYPKVECLTCGDIGLIGGVGSDGEPDGDYCPDCNGEDK